ncbi:MAG: hypothetical protein QOH63_4228 [Acidobacteriota bacterium]|jgi:tetratricopeptide (TPR) repeat protein|nr:hypothetical protein [Acidobacteriota bacterium]
MLKLPKKFLRYAKLALLVLIITLAYKFYPWVNTWYSSLNADQHLLIITTAVLAVIALLPLWYSWYGRRKKQSERPFLYKLLIPKEFYAPLGVPKNRLVRYIPRKQLVDLWGNNLIPHASRIIFHGMSGFGKSREAVELIKRISKNSKYQIAYRQYAAVLPSQRSHDLAKSRVVLFIDNLQLERGTTIGQDGEIITIGEVGLELRSTINFFENNCQQLIVILTMQTPQFEVLKSSSPKFVEEFQVVELQEMKADERRAYAEGLAGKLNCQPINQSLFDILAEYEDKSLNYIYSFFDEAAEEAKQQFDAEDVRLHQVAWKEMSAKEFIRHSTKAQQSVLQALSCLEQFRIEANEALVKRLFFKLYPKKILITRRNSEFKRALGYLSKRCLTISKNGIHAVDYLLTLNTSDNSDINSDLSHLTAAALDLAQPGFLKRREISIPEAVELLNIVTRRLNMHKLPGRALEIASAARKLAPRDERALFQTGLTLMVMDSANRIEAERWFRRALEVDPGNKFVSHTLASLYFKRGHYDEALSLLNEALRKYPDDLLILNLKLEILREANPGDSTAVLTYRELRRLIKESDAEMSQKIYAELSCARFLASRRKHRNRGVRRLEKAVKRIHALIDKAPHENTKIKVMAYHVLGCLLYEELKQPDQAIHFLHLALDCNPFYAPSAHKLSTIYQDEAAAHEEQKEYFLKQAEVYLEKALELNSQDVHKKLTWAVLQGKLQDWNQLEPERYWSEVQRVLHFFWDALQPNEDLRLFMHNSCVHNAAASFLWHVEVVAYKSKLQRPAKYQGAESEFYKSLELEALCGANPPENVRKQLAFNYFKLGEYIITTSGNDPQRREKVREYIKKSFELSQQGSLFNYLSKNSLIESYLGELFLQNGDYDKAKFHLEKAIELWEGNREAWRLRGKVAEQERKFDDALLYYEKNADLQKLPELFRKIRDMRKPLVDGGLIVGSLDEELRLSYKAFELDPEGEITPINISIYAYDKYRKARADKDSDGLTCAKDLLIKAARKFQSKGMKSRASFDLWHAGECVRLLKRRVDEESIKLYTESVKINNTKDQLDHLSQKIWRLKPKSEVVACFIRLINEGLEEEFFLSELATYCEYHNFVLTPDTVTGVEFLINKYPMHPNRSKLKLFVDRQKMLKNISGSTSTLIS